MHSEFQKILKSHYESGSLSHSYLIEGNVKENREALFSFFEENTNIKTRGNPDFQFLDVETLMIDEARNIKEKAYLKETSGGAKVFVITFSFITGEAQNSLLKLFEETPLNTHLFLLTQTKESILPTLLSRLTTLSSKNKLGNEKRAKKFLASSPPERIKQIQKIVKDKDKNEALGLLNELESLLYEKKKAKDQSVRILKTLERIVEARGFLYKRSPSIKMTLENIAITTPKF